MKFDEVREGDTVRTHAEFKDGTVIDTEFTVTYVHGTDFGSRYVCVSKYKTGRKSLNITLVSRPMTTPKVGDSLTYEQIQALPDHAVFLGLSGEPRTVLDGKSYVPGLTTGRDLTAHDDPGTAYRLIYLPEEDN